MTLIDTHTLIWFMFDDTQLSDKALSTIKTEDKVYVSIASLWEIAIKQSIGKLDIEVTSVELADKCSEAGIDILSITPKQLDYISKLPSIHNDPFDRLIISQAITEGLSIVTKDEKIAKYDGVNVIW
ncbi:PIN domain nuclease, a component of toxin-antitoxin system (PIN domain) [Butyrivibrio sp. Su6]|uniref:type II toxin-antitoxin system VapC family toxin n=1 Tax=Butyrivibrio sp. Su6 TaxID=1520810 RepID=UPI00089E40EC|nr:type II toxin-antitoxin system VapC family toxin [Butyrivibrio sp. Su6]SEG45798.1 PIN domain nuclease, a component of toxin-antitoxin system (PIN domain) [Butyrivibrio sp. Su6]